MYQYCSTVTVCHSNPHCHYISALCYQYVRQPQLSKRCSSIAVEILYAIRILLPNMKGARKNYELISKTEIELHLFQQYFTPHTPPLKQGEIETTLSPDLPSTNIIRSTIPFRKCFKSSPMSDLVTRYGPQTTRFSM